MAAGDTEHFRQQLLEERARLAGTLNNLHEENARSLEDEIGEETYDNHLADSATVTFDREIDLTLEENSSHLLAAIDGALQRVEEGTFGTCVRCGHRIAIERLEAMPYATKCIECKRLEERG